MLRRIGILGFGRFGRALSDLATEAGLTVRAHDPAASVPSHFDVTSPRQLVEQSELVVIATPVDTIASVLSTIRPHLGTDHLVIDVGSVKQQPIAALSAALGSDVPWIGTHPLFGPTNIARGDGSLRAVVCPNEHHPGATMEARRFYQDIGCEVIEQPAEEHDRVMARTHAIAFFVAKGLVDMGADEGLPFSPPSFQALAQTIETVRSDASHLFLAIERANPYASQARQDLIDALARVHGELDLAISGVGVEPNESLQIAPSPESPVELGETRDLIDELDRELVELLARRIRLASRAGTIKADHGRPVRDPARERDLIEKRQTWGEDVGLSEAGITDVFSAILRLSRSAQT